MPRVSVIIPTFNSAPFLGRSIGSALAQSYTDFEVVVVDDGSTDDTGEVVAQFGGRVRYFYQPNAGPAAARNLALSIASGELIAYLDADDMWYPHKLERQVMFMDAHRECALVHSDIAVIDESDRVTHLRFNRETMRDVPKGSCVRDLLRDSHVQTLTVVERRDCLEKVGGFDERLKTNEDYFHWILAAMSGMVFGYIDEPLAMYRWRDGSLSSSRRQMSEDLVAMLEFLLGEKLLVDRYGREAADIVLDRLYALRRELAYLDRLEGRTSDARRCVINLIRARPLRAELYIDLLKACVPSALATRLRTLKEQWG